MPNVNHLGRIRGRLAANSSGGVTGDSTSTKSSDGVTGDATNGVQGAAIGQAESKPRQKGFSQKTSDGCLACQYTRQHTS